jgi:hypothetical protein
MGNFECLQANPSVAGEIKSENYVDDPVVPDTYKRRVDSARWSNSDSTKEVKEIQKGNVKIVVL